MPDVKYLITADSTGAVRAIQQVTGKVYEAERRIQEHPVLSTAQPVLILKETGEAADAAFFDTVKEKDEKDLMGDES